MANHWRVSLSYPLLEISVGFVRGVIRVERTEHDFPRLVTLRKGVCSVHLWFVYECEEKQRKLSDNIWIGASNIGRVPCRYCSLENLA
jgi:hypothetical protein